MIFSYTKLTMLARRTFIALSIVCLLAGCAQTSPQFEIAKSEHADGILAQQIFETTYIRHGGAHISALNDVNVAIDGEWHYLITKIQPEVSDKHYRQQSEERILIKPSIYAALYNGDAGTKQVLRSTQEIEVAYNNEQNVNTTTEKATALTADAFYLFTLGPLALHDRVRQWVRLEDGKVEDKSYYRINGELLPGIGLSNSDFITLWIDKATNLTFRMHITLEGFESTKGAHVDTTFSDYIRLEKFTFPTHFFERVRGPISIDAHEWWYTGIDINRGLGQQDLQINEWSQNAAMPAVKLKHKPARE